VGNDRVAGTVSDPPGVPTGTIQTLSSTWGHIAALGAGLSESNWKQPTDLAGWSVQDVLSHIIGTERFLEGLPLAQPCAMTGDHVRNAGGGFIENEVAARRSMAGTEVLAEWNELIGMREHTLANADAEYFAQPMATPTGPGTMADFLEVRILDCWIHEQDIRRAIGQPGNLGGVAAEHTVDRLIRTIPIVVGKRAACPEGSAMAIRITGDIERLVVCEVHDGRALLIDASVAHPVCTITMDTEAFLTLATGRHTADALGPRVGVQADRPAGIELGHRAIDQFNMMI